MVSLIITTYNYAKYIERAVRSALDQSLGNEQYELIIVNDCSTDHTKEILGNYETTARIFHLEKNIGLAAARNFGIKKARGQYIIFLDADDYIQRDLLKVLSVFLNENNRLDAVAVDYYLVNEYGDHAEHIDANDKPIACGIMFRKDLLYNVGLYDENFRAREEEDLRMRFLARYSIYHIPLPLYRYRMHENNLTKNADEMDKYQDALNKKHNTI
jgi:glycosyltransferase involved in cell wall biosynthesis